LVAVGRQENLVTAPQNTAAVDSVACTKAQRPQAAGSVLLFEAHPNLSGIPDIFADMTPAELRRVVDCGRRVDFDSGDELFRQGEPHRGIFVLRAGVVRSFYVSPNGREITLANWSVGNFVGGPDIFGDGVHVWSGTAVEPGYAVQLPGAAVRELMTQIPSFAVGLVQGLAFKGKCYSALLQMLGTRSVVERLAQLLLNFAQLHGVDTDGSVVISASASHEELAAMVGATRQWVSITLERLRKRGVIQIRNRRLVILRVSALRVIADGRQNL
jgi:CRP/FNR family cyclic AMP-dependent transcriptional regulator